MKFIWSTIKILHSFEMIRFCWISLLRERERKRVHYKYSLFFTHSHFTHKHIRSISFCRHNLSAIHMYCETEIKYMLSRCWFHWCACFYRCIGVWCMRVLLSIFDRIECNCTFFDILSSFYTNMEWFLSFVRASLLAFEMCTVYTVCNVCMNRE